MFLHGPVPFCFCAEFIKRRNHPFTEGSEDGDSFRTLHPPKVLTVQNLLHIFWVGSNYFQKSQHRTSSKKCFLKRFHKNLLFVLTYVAKRALAMFRNIGFFQSYVQCTLNKIFRACARKFFIMVLYS